MKKFCAAITAVSMLLSSANVVYAENSKDPYAAEPAYMEYDYIILTGSYLSINGKTAHCKSEAKGMEEVTKIEATQYLEKKTLWWWDPVDDWSLSVNGNNLEMTNYKSELGSGTYRLRTVFTVYVSGDSEHDEVISEEITI